MKIIKIILGILLFIVIVPLVAALFLKKDYHVERSIDINLPKEKIYDYVKMLKNQNSFSTWTKGDPDLKTTFSGEDGSIGAKSAWVGKVSGEGEQEIVKMDFANRIDVKLHFIKPFDAMANAYYTFETLEGNKTKITWGIDGKDNYPMNLMQVFINYDEMMGKEFAQGLQNLKTILEANSQKQ